MLSGQNENKSCKELVRYFEDVKIRKIKNALSVIIFEERFVIHLHFYAPFSLKY